MREWVKSQILELVVTLEDTNKLLKQLADQKESTLLINTLADEQEAAVAMGNQIEASEGEGTLAVSLLEKYCEVLWEFSQAAEQTDRRGAWKRLVELLGQIRQEIEAFPVHIVAVFLPYKASMWGSMESVWRAADADPACRAYVIPIPYVDLKDGQITTQHYEGYEYPDYVPVSDYKSVSMSELRPDMAFVHNPYDGNNLVTRIPQEYYSDQLKRYVKKLIYIPYFLTIGVVAPSHRSLPVYYHADQIVVQNEKMIASFAGDIPREKFLPLGHPMADQVLYLEANKPDIPREWKPMLANGEDFGGRRTVMLNTSISRLLKDRQRFLDKLEYLFRAAGANPGILLIWRPHPLLMSSAHMADERLAQRLQDLEDLFLREKIGVLDKTPDVNVTVALCDAYLGEFESSVLNLFGVAGKPRFYINNRIPEERETKQVCCVSGRCSQGNAEYLLLDELGWIVTREGADGELTPLAAVSGREYVEGRAYSHMELKEGRLYVYPAAARGIFSYDLQSGQKKKYFPAVSDVPEQLPDFGKTEVSGACLSFIKGEQFKKGNTDHVWRETKKNTPEDYFHFLAGVKEEELTGYRGVYQMWIANLDGSCGQKIYDTVLERLKG